MAHAICRTKKLKTWGEIAKVGRHNERTKAPLNADPKLAQQNQFLVVAEGELHQRVKDYLKAHDITPRANAVLAIEYVLAVSPDWSGDVKKWAQDSLDFLSNRHGAHIVSAVLHLDEKTPHLQAVVVPIDTKQRLNCRSFLGGVVAMQALQDDYWSAVKSHGLERGERGSKRRHVPQRELYKNSNAIEEAVENAIATIPEKKIFESADTYTQRISEHLKTSLTPVIGTAKNGLLTQTANKAQASAARQGSEANQAKQRAESDMQQLKREQADRLREIPVHEVFSKLLGSPWKKSGLSVEIESDGYKFICTGQKFAEFKAGVKGGGGAIDAAKAVLKCDYKEAIRWLAAEFSGAELEPTIRVNFERLIPLHIKDAKAHPVTPSERVLALAPPEPKRWEVVEKYLVTERGLDRATIVELHAVGDVWANYFGSVVFAHRDSVGNLTGATIRGTDDAGRKERGLVPWKQTIGPKEAGFFRVGSLEIAELMIVCESPIEALSMRQANVIAKPAVYASTAGGGGLGPILAEATRRRLKVIAAQNGDQPGNEQALRTIDAAKSKNLPAVRAMPAWGKDWNDFLRFIQEQLHRLHFRARKTAKKLSQFCRHFPAETTLKRRSIYR